MIRLFTSCALAFSLSNAAMAEDFTSTAHYLCHDGSDLSVAYITPDQGNAYAVLLLDGALHIARSAISASGARYVGVEDEGLSWHVKRGEGLLEQIEEGDPAAAMVRFCSDKGL